ncbi:MAG: ribosome biogenesis GTPase Der, partial [Thermogutta sp.]|nr:ribosome biogenesis GTPase Der [Thermogutta sp.]
MDFPRVVIVGRPNVGKSSILNWLAGRRVSVVDALAGVTRDRVSERITVGDRHVELVDTGGIGIVDEGDLARHVERQIAVAMASADVILFVTDTRAGITPLDEEVARRLRSAPCPVLCVANKTDAPSWDAAAAEFTRFGRPVIAVSAEQRRGREDLLEALGALLPPSAAETPEPEVMKLAIVGRRNVGKSTFINTLAREERMIVSEIPGTTRDSVDVRFEIDGRTFIAIDTPGVMRRKSVRENVEFYGLVRVRESIRRADVVLLFFDAAGDIARV